MCELEGSCAFFQSAEGFGQVIKAVRRTLCSTDPQNCARFIVHKKLGPEAVPENLFPCDFIQAERLAQKQSLTSEAG
jgi:hypothetical protein